MKFIFDFLLHTWLWNHITHLILRHRCDGILEYKLFQTELWPQNSEPNQTKDIGGRETMLWIFSFRFSREHCSLTLFLRIFPFFLLFSFPCLSWKQQMHNGVQPFHKSNLYGGFCTIDFKQIGISETTSRNDKINNGILLPKLFEWSIKTYEFRGWRLRICKNSERSEQFLVRECFFNLLLEVSHI